MRAVGAAQPLHPELYEDYKSKLEAGGISFLENTSVFMKNSAGEKIRITGLELPDPFFVGERFRS